ncbi:MAG: hypothetical protein U0610_22560 [bacterium]
MLSLLSLLAPLAPWVLAPPAAAQLEGSVVSPSGLTTGPTAWGEFRLDVLLETAFRDSTHVRFPINHPFPPDFLPPGETTISLETPAGGPSLELVTVSLGGAVDFSPDIAARVRVDVVDRYSENPSSNDDVLVREAWLRFGQLSAPLERAPGTTAYARIGRAPRFSRPPWRNLESWGLVSTAIGRFEEDQLEVGGTLGEHLYWRGALADGNPLFFRDPNALAGDNGTAQRVPGHVEPDFQSGFPILYDTLPQDVNLDGDLQYGGGLGARWIDDDRRRGIDALGWYFQRRLAARAPIDGSFYGGDLDLLNDASGLTLPFHGARKLETGVNVLLRYAGLRLFGQFVHQDIAALVRHGFEVELAYRIQLDGWFASGDLSVLNWVQPAFRFSSLDNRFRPEPGFVAPSMAWDWRKYDAGVRVGVIRGLDATLEYSHHDVVLFSGRLLHPDELLATLRLGL